MKKYKWQIILLLVIVILLVIAIVFSEDESKYIKEVSVNEVLKMKENKESFILYIKQTNCTHCKAFTPNFIAVLKKNKLKAYAINLTNLTEDEQTIYDDNFTITGTPTVLFYIDGSESLMKLEGEQTKDKITERLKSTGFIE